MATFKIETGTSGMVNVYTPYNQDFVARIKQIGGRKWNSADRCWSVPETEVDAVRQHMMDVFGETDLPAENEHVTAEVRFDSRVAECRSSVVLFGKVIARAWGRDSGAAVGDDVTLVSGHIGSGGSRANWDTTVADGTIVRIRNLTRAALELDTDYDITILDVREESINREALADERARLLARIAEIDKLLAE